MHHKCIYIYKIFYCLSHDIQMKIYIYIYIYSFLYLLTVFTISNRAYLSWDGIDTELTVSYLDMYVYTQTHTHTHTHTHLHVNKDASSKLTTINVINLWTFQNVENQITFIWYFLFLNKCQKNKAGGVRGLEVSRKRNFKVYKNPISKWSAKTFDPSTAVILQRSFQKGHSYLSHGKRFFSV